MLYRILRFKQRIIGPFRDRFTRDRKDAQRRPFFRRNGNRIVPFSESDHSRADVTCRRILPDRRSGIARAALERRLLARPQRRDPLSDRKRRKQPAFRLRRDPRKQRFPIPRVLIGLDIDAA